MPHSIVPRSLGHLDRFGGEVYECYGPDEALLYVGCSLSALARLRQHRPHAGWFPQLAAVAVTEYRTYSDALIAEARTIRDDRPIWNVTQYPHRAVLSSRPLVRWAWYELDRVGDLSTLELIGSH